MAEDSLSRHEFLEGWSGASLGRLRDTAIVARPRALMAATPNPRDYLCGPQARVKANHMPFSGFANASDADDVMAYLQAYK